MRNLFRKLFTSDKKSKLKALIQKERERQKAQDDKRHRKEIEDLQEAHALELDYQAQSYEAQLSMLQAELRENRRREKQLTQLEYRLKKQVKRTTSMTTIAYGHVFNVANFLQKEAFEIKGLLDELEKEAPKIEG